MSAGLRTPPSSGKTEGSPISLPSCEVTDVVDLMVTMRSELCGCCWVDVDCEQGLWPVLMFRQDLVEKTVMVSLGSNLSGYIGVNGC